jgi:hypothetical protein
MFIRRGDWPSLPQADKATAKRQIAVTLRVADIIATPKAPLPLL